MFMGAVSEKPMSLYHGLRSKTSDKPLHLHEAPSEDTALLETLEVSLRVEERIQGVVPV